MKNPALRAAKDVALVGVMSALLSAVKFALSSIPNIEGVSLLLIVYALGFGWKRATAAALVFSTMEILLYGFNTWVLMYYINWPLLIFVTLGVQKLLRRLPAKLLQEGPAFLARLPLWLRSHSLSTLCYALVSAFFGFSFGFLCAVPQAFFYSGSRGYFPYLFAYWVNGLTFDVVHMAGNFVLAVLLLPPLLNLLPRIRKMV